MIHYNLGRTYYKISISEKIKTINNKIDQNKALYIRKNNFACLFSVHNTISLSPPEQVCLMSLIKHACS